LKVLNLNDCFPTGRDGKRSPLPKQKLFLEEALGKKYKYIRYSGGIGSGKTMIGCITMLHLAVLKRGDYLIGRQFMPELKSTTWKQFHEICPPELIVEKRVADMETVIRTVDGGVSTIMFRGLEEPDKLRSLNICAFLIDEAAQVSESAFMLLQGRLRGPHWRKGLIVQNPGGRDWSWRWHVKQDHIVNPEIKKLFFNIRAPSTENVHLPDGYIDTMLASWSKERIEREIMGSDDTFEGMVYTEFDRSVNVVKPFRLPDTWAKRVGIDHGFRNPAAWIYGALDHDGNMYVYREYYQKEKIIEDICKDNRRLIGDEKIEQARIDPSVKATRGATGKSDYDVYLEHLPNGFPLLMAQNDVTSGIDRVKSYMRPDKTGRPRLYIFDTCTNLIDEILQYKWEEQISSRQGKVNDKEKPVKNNDHAVDAMRYLMMTAPDITAAPKKDAAAHLKYGTIERALYEELQEFKSPPKRDPFGDL
jgi:PBSX family phage terminase large subunit